MDENSSYNDIIKEHLKESLTADRRVHRDRIVDKRRGILGGISSNRNKIIKIEEVKSNALKIKHKGNVTDKDLKLLSRAFIESETNIIEFVNTDGALHSLIRELTGSDSSHQLLAAECCVNIALGNSKVCFKVARSAGPYLITFLKGMSVSLMSLASWALGNLAGSDVKTLELLKSQGLMESLLDMINVEGVQSNVIYALLHFVKIGLPILSPDDLTRIAVQTVEVKNKCSDTYWLLYFLSYVNDCDEILLSMVRPCIEIIVNSSACIKKRTASIRILGNLAAGSSGNAAHLLIADFNVLFSSMEEMVLNASFPHLCKDMLWMFGNLFNHPSPSVQSLVQLELVRFKHLELMCIPLLRELR